MADVRVSKAALADFEEIMNYLERVAGRAVADRYAAEFTNVFEAVAAHPGLGAPRPRLGRDARLVSVPPYSIYYDGKPKGDIVIILRIVRGRRRATKALVNEGRQG